MENGKLEEVSQGRKFSLKIKEVMGDSNFRIKPYKRNSFPVNCGDFGNVDNCFNQLPTSFGSRRVPYGWRCTQQDHAEMEQKVLLYFDKKYSFDPSHEKWKLPEPVEMFKSNIWEDYRLQLLKEDLNAVKNKLNDFDLAEWHKHTRTMNMAADVLRTLKTNFQAEFVTQAWCKFYEIVMSFNLVPKSADKIGTFNSLHLCEAPGAFIAALNHYLKLNRKNLKWKWISTTLNPYYEGNPLSCMINDDRFILHTLKNWCFGADFTGNIMYLGNMEYLLETCREMGDIMLVTADGSIDCQGDPGEQEKIVSSLHYCETVAALCILSKGGNFLLKLFTIYEHETICLLYLLCCCFKDVHISKPATSKEGNSEVYVVCLDYHGPQEMKPWLKVLKRNYGEKLPDKAMFSQFIIPHNFMDKIYKCAEKFKKFQVDVIERNIRTFGNRQKPFEFSRKMREMVTNHFITKYKISKLNNGDQIVGEHKLVETVALNISPRNEEGTFSDRLRKRELKFKEQLEVALQDVNNLNIEWPYEGNIILLSFPQIEREEFYIQTGKPVHTLQSSKFCLGPLLKIRNQVLKLTDNIIINHLESGDTVMKHCASDNYVSELLFHYPDFKDKSKVVTLNFADSLWTVLAPGENTAASRNALCKIHKTLGSMWRGQNLLLLGYPMLTQLNVGIIYLLSGMFDKVGFLKPTGLNFGVIFIGYRSWNVELDSYLNNIEELMCDLKQEGEKVAVLSVVPINILCYYKKGLVENNGDEDSVCSAISNNQLENGNEVKTAKIGYDFYSCITHINNLWASEQIRDTVNELLLRL